MGVENLESVVDFINDHKLIERGDRVGLGVSGGQDSMALLHFLNANKDVFGINIVVINVNHNIRPNGKKDSQFVSKYCKKNGIPYVGYSVDVPAYAKQHKYSMEHGARDKRYECFALAVKKFKLNKIAVAHHQSDQAETILLHIFRGAGATGASGMNVYRDFRESRCNCVMIRPFLQTSKSDIIAYNYRNQIPYVQDESNYDNQMARNYLRNEVIPLIQKEWRNVEKNIVDFGRMCKMDDDYISGVANMQAILLADDHHNVRVPLNFFAYPYPVIARTLLNAFTEIDGRENIEKKHIDMIIELAQNGENGSRVDLPNNLYAIREYEYIAIVRRIATPQTKVVAFKVGKIAFPEFGTIISTKTISWRDAVKKRTTTNQTAPYKTLIMDVDKLPRGAKWRTRKDGDVFTPFGGGTKTLSKFLIDIKLPARLREKLPVLAFGNEIYAIAGVEISNKVKCIPMETLQAYILEFIKE